MHRYLESATEATSDGTSHSDEEEGHLPDFISFGVLILAMSVGIFTRTVIAKWIP